MSLHMFLFPIKKLGFNFLLKTGSVKYGYIDTLQPSMSIDKHL